jgi:uncharacterized membrane protein YraQ (UPF0718 family)
MTRKKFAAQQLPTGEKESLTGVYLFLLVVVILYAAAFLLAPERAADTLQFSLKLLRKLVPVLVLVFFLMFLTNLLVKPAWIKKHVGRDSGLKGFLIAVVGGILSMGPIYVWYGILKELQSKGMRTALIASFLYGRSVKLALLPLMIHYFGLLYTFVLVFYLVIFSVFNGLLTERLSTDFNAQA